MDGIKKDVRVSDELYDLEAISLDGDGSGNEEEKNRPVLELPEDEFETKVDQWNLSQEPIKERIVQAEHFDKTSMTHSLQKKTNTSMLGVLQQNCSQKGQHFS